MNDITMISNKTNCDLAAEQLNDLIFNGQYAPKSKLPNESDLAKMFGVGRGAVREALKGLQASGVVTSTAGKGTFVTENALSCIQLSRFSKMIVSANETKDLVELRFALEPELARLAAMRREGRDLKEMQRCITAMKRSETKNDLLYHGANFHLALCKATYNSMMIFLHYSITMQLLRLRRMDFLSIDVYKRGIDAHQEILDAIQAADPELAKEKMRQHIELEYGRYLN